MEESKKMICPKCGEQTGQMKKGFTKAGSQRFLCYICKHTYTPIKKKWIYSEEERKEAKKLYFLGNTGRGVGKFFNMHQSNIYRWLKEEEVIKKKP
ncbi:MAG: hypothetical protein FWE37_02870 [Spirochaetaceae bacterium]|nr:hypothetical protein [Spirochaetaceae bacterium]